MDGLRTPGKIGMLPCWGNSGIQGYFGYWGILIYESQGLYFTSKFWYGCLFYAPPKFGPSPYCLTLNSGNPKGNRKSAMISKNIEKKLRKYHYFVSNGRSRMVRNTQKFKFFFRFVKDIEYQFSPLF